MTFLFGEDISYIVSYLIIADGILKIIGTNFIKSTKRNKIYPLFSLHDEVSGFWYACQTFGLAARARIKLCLARAALDRQS
jgi:hypothetical protein